MPPLSPIKRLSLAPRCRTLLTTAITTSTYRRMSTATGTFVNKAAPGADQYYPYNDPPIGTVLPAVCPRLPCRKQLSDATHSTESIPAECEHPPSRWKAIRPSASDHRVVIEDAHHQSSIRSSADKHNAARPGREETSGSTGEHCYPAPGCPHPCHEACSVGPPYAFNGSGAGSRCIWCRTGEGRQALPLSVSR